MSSTKTYLAVDLGASSGRVVAGRFDGHRLALEDVHRFPNGGVRAGGRLYWNVLALWSEMLGGLRESRGRYGDSILSVGVDTWGVDFGLLGSDGQLLANPLHYRDEHTNGALERAFAVAPREEIFRRTGLQFMQFNSLYQLAAMNEAGNSALAAAESFLMIPDLFHWLLTGERVNEFTNATTTQFFDPQRKEWAVELFEKIGLPAHILGEVAQPGANLGRLTNSVAAETGMHNVDVVLPGTHDTASAVLAVPAAARFGTQPDWCYISSGTWSLMGAETPAPVINDQCLARNFTNEGGVGGSIRLLKNIAGLWLVQECRRIWAQAGHEFAWSQLVALAAESSPLACLIDPDDESLIAPADMPQAIRAFCERSGQAAPETEGAVIRCALESLALRYRLVHGWTEELVGGELKTIHIVGGGAQNELLCQMTADACDRPVVAGPVEATAIGNLMMQAVAHGDVGSIEEAREVIRDSFAVKRYEPRNTEPWREAAGRFAQLLK
ncbi:MAG: FGGY-family carbohydrate kinase [Pirellulaceae bacterium]|jgi:rhamnulokinase|nr:FGGY-family carbohydrate kinase [Pirellulaceae bacterium]MDP7019397.1 FGGY-family carbohydrate kinase [Pirellulaceae bacterium]